MKQSDFDFLTPEQKNIYCYIEDTIVDIEDGLTKYQAIEMIFNKIKDKI